MGGGPCMAAIGGATDSHVNALERVSVARGVRFQPDAMGWDLSWRRTEVLRRGWEDG
jgi:hypothetical protein